MRVFQLLLVVLICRPIVMAATVENANVAGPDTAPLFAEHVPFSADVVIRNPYDTAVRVERVESSCTCTKLELASRFLLPHGTTTVHATIDNANRSGPQSMGVTVYLTDPICEPIEVKLWWTVTPDVSVDVLPSSADPRAGRPADRAWRDVYKFTAHERPDEMHRLRKRILMGSPAEAAPAGGLKILGVDYPGTLWKFTPEDLGNGTWLVTATARDPEATGPVGLLEETATVRTNHPRKPAIALQFVTNIDPQAGREAVDLLAP